MNRDELLKIIPKPTNLEIITYDTSLSYLIDTDVFENYYKDLSDFKIKKENYILLNNEIKDYEIKLKNIYLYNSKWNEEDYLEMLQKDTKQYNTLYNNINKIENQIEILNKKYNSINEKIEIQRAKDIKNIENKKQNIDDEIKDNKEQIQNLKIKLDDLKIDLEKINKKIEENKLENQDISTMINSLDNDSYTCKYCGTVITHKSSKKRIYNLLQKNLDKNLEENKKLEEKKYNIEKDVAYYKTNYNNHKSILKNDIQFKKEDYSFYIKKSIEVLKLEAIRDNILLQINKLKKEYDSSNETKTKQYKDLKDRIDKYKLSLENIRSIKENKENFKDKYSKLKTLQEECKQLKNNLNNYIKFISIFYKIYEKKINDYFGKDFKFKFFTFDDLELKNIFKVYYKDVDYYQLDKKNKDEFDKIYSEKILYFS